MMGGGGFGGGGMLGGGVAGGMFGGNSRQAASQPGLPFAGIPSELQEGVDKLLESEPDHGEPKAVFRQQMSAEDHTRITLRRLLTRYWRLCVLAMVFVTITGVIQQAGPYLTGVAIDDGIIPRHFSVVVWLSVAYIACVLVTATSQRLQVMVTGRLAAQVMNDLRIKVFAHLQRLSLDFYTGEKAGVLMSRMTSDIENLQNLVQDGLANFAVQAITMVVITIVLFVMNVRLALITVVLIIPILTAMSMWFRVASQRGYLRVRDGIANVLADLDESLHGVRVVTAHNRQVHNTIHHRNVVGDYRRANLYTAQINAVYGPGTQILGYLGQGVLLAIGGVMVVHHSLSLGELTAFFLYLNRFFSPIQLLVQQYNTFQQGQASVTKLGGLLLTEPTVSESPLATDIPPIVGNIVFRDVTFGYEEDNPVIRDVNLDIAAGETVAFVGPTGAGKSTLAKLAIRFYDPTSGSVLIDGHDLRDVTLASLRRQLGVVPQEPFLFAGTIRDNLTFARPGATDDEIWEAIRAVGLAEVIERLPQSLDTIVHERGQTLSSGERQLLALCRAFLAQPRVLVLDEATSNLDLQSETKIESALDVLLEQRTAVLIAHRLSTAMKADRIVVVDEGRIIEIGSHDELVRQGGRYAQMYATWVSHARGGNAARPDHGVDAPTHNS